MIPETTISAQLVKALRDRTNAPFKDCKDALLASKGDMDQAIQIMAQTGKVKALGKANRATQQGIIALHMAQLESGARACLLELNCETDFVAKSEPFQQFNQKTGTCALAATLPSLEALREAVEAERLALIAQIGENVILRRFTAYEAAQEGMIGAYTHGDANGARIGAMVLLEKPDQPLARSLAMHIAAMAPQVLSIQDLPSNAIGAPEELVLLKQPFVKDSSKSIEALLQESGNGIQRYVRFAVGESEDL